LQALVFCLPFVIAYEIGALYSDRGILARSLLADVLEAFGPAGAYLPGLIVVVVLLAWHVARRDGWALDWRLYLAMAAESIALATPLIMLALLWGRGEPAWAVSLQAAVGIEPAAWQQDLLLAIGAGVYEELVFRLVAITLLHLLLVDLIGLPFKVGSALAIASSAVLFAAYHFDAGNPFTWLKFLFYSVAGAYFGVLFAVRGFGIVAATHAFYDIFYVVIKYGLLPDAPGEGA
jgi:hypothetical protein